MLLLLRTYLVWSLGLMLIKEFTFHFYLSMVICYMTRKSRDIWCFTINTQNQIKCQKVSCFNLSSMFLSYILLNVIILHLTNAQHVLNRVLTKKCEKSCLCLIIKLPKMVKTIIFLSLCVSNLATYGVWWYWRKSWS